MCETFGRVFETNEIEIGIGNLGYRNEVEPADLCVRVDKQQNEIGLVG